jgi:hypothetical protein
MTVLHHYAAACTMIAALALVASCDPVHNDAIDALGGEAPNVRTGPLHRPGQPCLLCHDGTIGNPPQFTVAGTVYVDISPAPATPAVGVEITMTNVNDGSQFTRTTNEAGNFYATPTEWMPSYPYKVTMQSGATKACMISYVGREGSCAGCHVEPPGVGSPGRVVLKQSKDLMPDGGCP